MVQFSNRNRRTIYLSPNRFSGHAISHLVPINPGGQLQAPTTLSHTPPLVHWHTSWQSAPNRPCTQPAKCVDSCTTMHICSFFWIVCNLIFSIPSRKFLYSCISDDVDYLLQSSSNSSIHSRSLPLKFLGRAPLCFYLKQRSRSTLQRQCYL